MSQPVKVPLLVKNGLTNTRKDFVVCKLLSENLLKQFVILFFLFLYATTFSLEGSRQYFLFSLVLVYIPLCKSLFLKSAWLPLTIVALKKLSVMDFRFVTSNNCCFKETFSYGFAICIWIIRRHGKLFISKII